MCDRVTACSGSTFSMSLCACSWTKLAAAAAAAGALYVAWRYFGCGSCASRQVPAEPTASEPVTDAQKLNLIVISGPSGVGKGTIIERTRKEFPTAFAVSVSHTSRAPRDKEVNGVSYWFSTKEDMQKMNERGEFLEMCQVHTNFYGTSYAALDTVRQSGKCVIVECDVQGSQKIKKALQDSKSTLNAAYMFITCPSFDELERRIRGRDGDDAAKINVRLATARSEDEFLRANRSYFDFVLVNDNLAAAYTDFVRFLRAKKAL